MSDGQVPDNMLLLAGRIGLASRAGGAPAIRRTTHLISVNDPQKQHPRQWMERLVHRKYIELANPRTAGHFSARLEHGGTGCYFPLHSADAARAAARAAEIQHSLDAHGWNQTCQRYAAEFTLAVFWNGNPLLCTYTTLLTSLRPSAAGLKSRPGGAKAALRIVIVEGNDAIRHALVKWAQHLPGCACVDAFASPGQAQGRLSRASADLVLFNRTLPELQPTPRNHPPEDRSDGPAIFGFGVYESSDDIFISHTGVSNGYFLRRTPPSQVLAPLTGSGLEGSLPLREVILGTQRYFQDLIAGPPALRSTGEQAALTPREEEILLRLSKGYQDKQIADTLNISTWTVHNHIKNIFKKLGVHSRTQAVIKHLQK